MRVWLGGGGVVAGAPDLEEDESATLPTEFGDPWPCSSELEDLVAKVKNTTDTIAKEPTGEGTGFGSSLEFEKQKSM